MVERKWKRFFWHLILSTLIPNVKFPALTSTPHLGTKLPQVTQALSSYLMFIYMASNERGIL